jgi:Arc/MetJ-type ribon-helix-helix transcriptional regulator
LLKIDLTPVNVLTFTKGPLQYFEYCEDTIMQQIKVTLTPSLVEFLDDYKRYGFPNKSAMVQAALLQLQEEIEQHSLKQSADLYAEFYEQDTDLQALAEAALAEWPE